MLLHPLLQCLTVLSNVCSTACPTGDLVDYSCFSQMGCGLVSQCPLGRKQTRTLISGIRSGSSQKSAILSMPQTKVWVIHRAMKSFRWHLLILHLTTSCILIILYHTLYVNIMSRDVGVVHCPTGWKGPGTKIGCFMTFYLGHKSPASRHFGYIFAIPTPGNILMRLGSMHWPGFMAS